MMRFRRFVFMLALLCAACGHAPGIILLDAGDPTANTTTPGDNSGWQYEGQFGAFLGTPIAPYYFITAAHIGYNVGDVFVFHGQSYTTVAMFDDAGLTDLRIWQVAASRPFPVYAPLYVEPKDANGNAIQTEDGQELRVFGRGTQRGAAMSPDTRPRGWAWGATDNVQRWGRNIVANIVGSGSDAYPKWFFVQASFDQNAPVGEAHLSVGDSGGGVFIFQNGLWRLAGVNYGVDDLYQPTADGSGYASFAAAIFDARGYYQPDAQIAGQYDLITGTSNVPTSFYSTQTASRNDWISGVTKVDPATLPKETFKQWLAAYFSPGDIGNSNVTGPNADPDGDGVTNLTEFAYNLDPTYAEATVLTAGTGIRGLPLIQVDPTTHCLTIEFVRRTPASGSQLLYSPQFASSTDATPNWHVGRTVSTTPINPRWERVKAMDTVATDPTAPTRIGRVRLTQLAVVIVSEDDQSN